MSRQIGFAAVLFMLLLLLGIVLPGIYKQRAASDRVVCQDHLRRIGFATSNATVPNQPLEKTRTSFPAGTIVNGDLKVEERLSWQVTLIAGLGQEPAELQAAKQNRKNHAMQNLYEAIDPKTGWESKQNAEAARRKITYLLCPGNVPEWAADQPAPTQYIGVGGLGLDTPTLPLLQAGTNAGIFRFNEPTRLASITDGLSQTASVLETNRELGPWIQGGNSTVRGVDPMLQRLIGVGKPFGGLHLGGTNVGMADGGVRFISEKVDLRVLRAMCTIAGGEVDFE